MTDALRKGDTSRKPQRGKSAGIANVLDFAGAHVGMAIIVDSRHLITCAHVVNLARRRDIADPDPRYEEEVSVGFPIIGLGAAFQAKVVGWRAPGDTPWDDIAVLQLACDDLMPEEAGIAILADVTGMPLDDDELSIFGLEERRRIGNHIAARFAGPTSSAWTQVDGIHGRQQFVEPGFSGAAVWDTVHAAVVGMVVAKKLSDIERVAYVVPTAELKRVWPSLQIEKRPLPRSFSRTWTALSATYFLLLLSHWASDRGIEAFNVATISGDHKQLASYFGMHIYAILGDVSV